MLQRLGKNQSSASAAFGPAPIVEISKMGIWANESRIELELS